ncbi:MAG TPA: winged helix-turn-helix domain-containing protein [Pyrinomonadaceae bacterium]|nr:winged helix-turn-helix domain-containing protein [Pyrinomonadaceae bacterium]
MNGQRKIVYNFADFKLVPDERSLTRDGSAIPLPPRAFDVLVLLVKNAGELVRKDEILSEVWPDSFVEESNIQVQISFLRKALTGPRDLIETVRKIGYRFVAVVDVVDDRFTNDAERTSNVGESHAAAIRPQSIGRGETPRAKGAYFLMIFGVCAIGIVAFAAVSYSLRDQVPRFDTSSSTRTRITKLTETGKVLHVAVAPDGSRIGYVFHENGRSRIVVSDIETGVEKEIVEPSETILEQITFAPDGKSILYAQRRSTYFQATLFQLPVDGGIPKQIVSDVGTRPTFSPDGNSFAFLRFKRGHEHSDLVIAKLSGTEQTLLSSDSTLIAPAWRPDGRSLSFFKFEGQENDDNNGFRLWELNLVDGTEHLISERYWQFGNSPVCAEWLSSGSGLIFSGKDQPSASNQIWFFNASSGSLAKVTNDLNDYSEITITKDSKTIFALQEDTASGIWLATKRNNFEDARPITNGAHKEEGEFGLDWTNDDRLVFTARTSGIWNVWIMNPDGTNRKQLTQDLVEASAPSVSFNNQDILYVSAGEKGYIHVWKMGLDGTEPIRLTNGYVEDNPIVFPNGKYFVFNALSEDHKRSLQVMSIFGGEPRTIAEIQFISPPAVSPDGTSVAVLFRDEKEKANKYRVAFVDPEGAAPFRSIEGRMIRGISSFRWSPDGAALTFSDCKAQICNLWNLPINGSHPVQLTNFTSDSISGFGWSKDGEQIAVARTRKSKDVVRITDFQ